MPYASKAPPVVADKAKLRKYTAKTLADMSLPEFEDFFSKITWEVSRDPSLSPSAEMAQVRPSGILEKVFAIDQRRKKPVPKRAPNGLQAPRAPNAFLLYRRERAPELTSRCPGMPNQEVSRLLGQRWREESEGTKERFRRLAAEVARANVHLYQQFNAYEQ